MLSYSLTPEQKKRFEAAVQIAFTKQLYADGMLTDMQLNQLIKMINEEIQVKEY